MVHIPAIMQQSSSGWVGTNVEYVIWVGFPRSKFAGKGRSKVSDEKEKCASHKIPFFAELLTDDDIRIFFAK